MASPLKGGPALGQPQDPQMGPWQLVALAVASQAAAVEEEEGAAAAVTAAAAALGDLDRAAV